MKIEFSTCDEPSLYRAFSAGFSPVELDHGVLLASQAARKLTAIYAHRLLDLFEVPRDRYLTLANAIRAVMDPSFKRALERGQDTETRRFCRRERTRAIHEARALMSRWSISPSEFVTVALVLGGEFGAETS